MKKYLALAVLGFMLVFAQPSLASAGYGCPVMPACPVCPPQVMPACPVEPACPCPTVMPACPVCPQAMPACPTCPPQLVYQPVLQPVQPVIQTVAEPVMSYRYRQVATCPNTCNPCAPYGMTGAAAPAYGAYGYGYASPAAPIVYEESEGFFEDFFGFD